MDNLKKFILGVGAPKAGTTWLYHYLQNNSRVNLGHKKEYHVFDTYFDRRLDYFIASVQNLYPESSFYSKYKEMKMIDRRLQLDHDFYGDYFSKLLANENTIVTGDLTPTYCLLNCDQFEYIKNLTEKYSLNPYIVYIIRDPVERFISLVKMIYRQKSYLGKRVNIDKNFHAFVEKIALSDYNLDISNYQKIITSLFDCFSYDRVYIGLYEVMHTNSEIDRLSKFVGIESNYDYAKKIFNATNTVDFNITVELREKLTKIFHDQYVFCQKLFGNYQLDKIWPNYQVT